MVQQTLFSTSHQTAQTSIEAFKSTRRKQATHKQRILLELRRVGRGGLTRDELASILEILVQSVSSPARALVKSGEVVELELTRSNQNGKQVKVLVLREWMLPNPWVSIE